MPSSSKVSSAFASRFTNSPAGRLHDAIVVVRPEETRNQANMPRSARAAAGASFAVSPTPSVNAVREHIETNTGAKAVSTIGNVPALSVLAPAESIEAIAERPEVIAVLPNFRIRPIRPTSVKYAKPRAQAIRTKLTWGLQELGVTDVWPRTKGKGVNVAVMDTGVHGDHPAIKKRLKKFMVFDQFGRKVKTNISFDSDLHGTHVCGTIAGGTTPDGIAIGVAPEANLFMAGVLVGLGTLQTLMAGISWAVEEGADIISMSLGFDYYEPLFGEVFQMLLDHYGVLPVAAIGNENYGNSSSPGNAYSTLSVGAVEKQDGQPIDVAFFSSGASLIFPNDPKHALVNKPDVCAPGVDVYSSIPPEQRPNGVFEYNYLSGTSMATPHTSATAALLMSAHPDASVNDIVTALKQTAKHPDPDHRPDNRWGWGFIQPAAALKALGS